MIKGHNIICISSIDWDFVWQGHQEIMSTFAKNGNTVLFIENTGIRTPKFTDFPRLRKRFLAWMKGIRGFRKESENLFIYSPLILPFPYSRIARWFNRKLLINSLRGWMKIMGFHDPIIWTFLPTRLAIDVIDNIDNKLAVYYCIADFSKLSDNPKKVHRTEAELINKSDVVFVQGDVLGEKCVKAGKDFYVFPFGVKTEVFLEYKKGKKSVPIDMKDVKRPVIGYVGGVHRHIDFNLIKRLSYDFKDCSIVLIGPLQTDCAEIKNLKNVALLGKKDFLDLPVYIDNFDIAIVPYQLNSYTTTVYPTKMNEYHIMGRPVVSTPLPEVLKFNAENNNLVYIGRTPEEFSRHVASLVSKKDGLESIRIESAMRNSWSARIEDMSQKMAEAMDRKKTEPEDWKDNLKKIYKRSSERILNMTVIALTAYYILFHTSFVWFIASPLKIEELPKVADAIVVFAGGVGESGRPGQGYEERLKHAVYLYEKGFAGNIIFSSGYSYAFKEADIMKTISLSMGVSQDAIIIEEEAVNTYQNVKYCADILKRHKWKKALLVSSPYHMRRSGLVFKKIAPDINIIYAPIPKSLFYKHENNAKLHQIKGILHEYLSIAYYWWKGYV
ncbi:MAG: YdcF family protein [Candidatus Omnitrophica bacterium]|nr:YdcF family protein [Candidatus Omnitrophota bacterium]